MLKNFLRVYHTVRYIKFIQFFYQIWYRIKWFKLNILSYNTYLKDTLVPVHTSIDVILSTARKQCNSDNEFNFLGIKHTFKERINWGITNYGKLWNYNLQYFEYLLDESISVGYRKMIIAKFSTSVLNKQVKAEPYPVSLRVINTILFNSRHQLLDQDTIKALKIQIDFLKHNLEYHLQANHLLENIFSLVISCYAINNEQLHKYSVKILICQLEEQILSDGGHYERSPMYHSIILGRLLLCIDIMQNNNSFDHDNVIAFLRRIAGRMLGWINIYSFPDGTFAIINDSTRGIAPDLSKLNKASLLLKIDPIYSSLTSSGFRKLKGADFEIIANVGNIMPSYQPGHTHADMLSFCFWGNNKNLIVDTGISTYENNCVREYERSTIAHNTITVEQKNQSDVWGSFRIGKRAQVIILEDASDKIKYSASGFAKENFSVEHIRSFEIKSKTLFVEDTIENTNDNLVSRLHFDVDVKPIINGKSLYFDKFRIDFLNGYDELNIEEYSQAIGFNHRVKALKLVAKIQKKSSFIISSI